MNLQDRIKVALAGIEAEQIAFARVVRLAAIKEAIQNGTYHVDAEKVAEKMLRDLGDDLGA
jgi:flagellar biosynthesis anti-sigma factor FlgM